VKYYSLLFLCSIFICFPSHTQNFNSFKKFPIENPLSYKSVRTITQDKDGFMWFGSQEGLHRYDGYQFLSFHHDSSDPTSLSSDVISRILIDKTNQIWVATRGGGLSLYREGTKDFQHLNVNTKDVALSDDNVNAILEDSRGNIWVGTENGLNIIVRTGEKWHVKQIKQELGNPKSLSHNTVHAMIQTSDGNIWVGTNGGGISVFDLNGDYVKQIELKKQKSNHSIGKLVNALFQDQSGYVWIGTVENGLIKYSPTMQTFEHYVYDEKEISSIASNTIEGIYQDSTKRIWIASDKGVMLYNQTSHIFKRVNHSITNPHSLTNDYVLTFFEDKNKMMWIGTFSGVNLWDPNMTTFSQYNDQRFPKISSSLIMDFSQLDDERLIFSTYSGGLYQLSNDKNSVTAFKFNHLFKDLRITSQLVDHNILWVGTRASGLFKVNLTTGDYNKYQADAENQNSISANSITDILKDRHGTLWVSTFHKGLNKFNIDGTFTRFEVTEQVSTKGPSTNHVLQMLEDNQGMLWLATYGGGINKFDVETETFLHLNHKDNSKTSLSSDFAWVMFQDKEDNLWIGTQAAGLNFLSRENLQNERFEFKHLDVKAGMRDQTVYGITQDSLGNIWFSSNRGVSYYSLKHDSFKHFDTRHGLIDLEYNHGAVFRGNDNTLYFGSSKGFSSVNPTNIIDEHSAPEIRLTNIYKLNEPIAFKESLSVLNSITFDYSDQLISFEYVGLNYVDPNSTRYKYRLLGFDEQWIDAGNLRRATYTNLPSGKYQLQVIAGNNDNMWSEPSINLAITVKAAPWNTWWAYLLYALLVALALLSYSRILNRKLVVEQKQKHFLKQQITEKTQNYLDKNIELEQANKQLENAATTDKLTGVKSRRYLDIYIEQASQLMAQIHQNILPVQRSVLPRLYLLMVKINNASEVNDSQLINLTDLLLYTRNQDDLVIRWSQDTFAIIGYEKDDNARELAQRLTARFKNIFVDTNEERKDMAIAYSFYPFNREQPMELSWDQVSVMTEQSLDMVSRNDELSWLGLHSPKSQPFNYLELLQVKDQDELSQIVKIKLG